MTDSELLRERVDTLERTLTEGHELGDLPDYSALASSIEQTDERIATLEEDVAELEAAVQALRGYVGNVRHVNREVERRADAALASVESIESEFGTVELVAPDGTRVHEHRPPDEAISPASDEQRACDDSPDDPPIDPTLLERIREAL